LPQSLRDLDPDFMHLTYGDDAARRGLRIARLGRGPFWFFYAGLRPIIGQKKLVCALVGLFVIDGVVRAIDVPAERR
jgi:hypothetical protein